MPDSHDDEAGGVEVVQKANLKHLIEASLEGFDVSRSRVQAARHLANLYTNLTSLRAADDAFQAEWATIWKGHLIDRINEGEYDIPWSILRRAKGILLDLLDRFGMGFQAELPPQGALALQAARQRLEDGIRGFKRPRQSEAKRRPKSTKSARKKKATGAKRDKTGGGSG